ncbi:MAG: hypothetical protein A2951_00890 [Candidatus Buchananbacteria bacterium RIFCSPLOWO2_01_FULL_56_15]|uniref:PABS domain-containing protein n=2 Tax=Candidatus Buchananiibacteriota TaxID=1817903 RepID=A0A1G1YE35_9BACT|nr:MAG: hypothetical protein A3J59_01520 [Candidatus Buchananbacteria bacterium RIFCSPHIGHO2_02_FULL_56_16]OGY55382.1 MAG: hypothetical protein A2951_00890 [Candidatus Buchananbacteria bacterium RIFCSPLOWO2_01_FULL_56_15]
MLRPKIGPLELIVFTAGTVVMILELIGSRILAPYLGTSIFVWTSLIGVILAALSVGYYLGGKFSQKNPTLTFLTTTLLVASLTLLLLPLVKDVLLFYVMSLGVAAGSVIATIILFTPSSLLLGMVSPYAIRLKAQQLESVGGVAGNLYALSTMGSIFGTFLAGFYLIPHFSSTQIIFGLSFVLLVCALLGGVSRAKVFTLLIPIGFLAAAQFVPSPYLFETDSTYNHIRVDDFVEPETGLTQRVLFLATETHSTIYLESDEPATPYHLMYRIDNLFKPTIERALALGGGAYAVPLDALKRHPQATITVVEIDPAVTDTARRYFKLRDDKRLTIHHQDGRVFLNTDQNRYDIIYGDAFSSFYSIPFQLTTREAVQLMSDRLTDDGVLILNLISSLDGETSLFFQSEYLTLQSVFPQIYLFPIHYYDGSKTNQVQNIIMVASKDKTRLTEAQLRARASVEQQALLDHLWKNDVNLDPKIKVLTDEWAPVDYYISKLL